MQYELTDLQLFLAIAENESLSEGAKRTHISAPSASYRLKNLENALGVQLFIRSTKGMELTPAGVAMRTHVRNIMDTIAAMRQDLGAYATGERGSVRIAANSSCMEGLLRCASRFLAAHPDVNLDIQECPSEDVAMAVRNRAVDVGLLAGDIDLRGLQSIHYSVDELVLVTSNSHPASTAGSMGFGETLDNDFIAMTTRNSNYMFLQRMAALLGRTYRARINAESFANVLALVEEGVGVAIVPRSVASQAVREGRIALVRLRDPWSCRVQCIVAVDFTALSKPAAKLVSFLEDGKPS